MAASAEAADKLRIGTEGAYPPFNQIDPNGKLIGFDIDIAAALCNEMQAECEFVTPGLGRHHPGLLAKKYDAIVASMSITEERQEGGRLHRPLLFQQAPATWRPKGSDIDPKNLKGKAVGAQRATISASYLEDNLGDEVDIKLYDTQENAYLDLESGRIDVVLADMLVTTNGCKRAPARIRVHRRAGQHQRQHRHRRAQGRRRASPALNKALAAIVANGTYAKINAKYFPFSIY